MFDFPDHKMKSCFPSLSPFNSPYQPSLSAAPGSLNGGASLSKSTKPQNNAQKTLQKESKKELMSAPTAGNLGNWARGGARTRDLEVALVDCRRCLKAVLRSKSLERTSERAQGYSIHRNLPHALPIELPGHIRLLEQFFLFNYISPVTLNFGNRRIKRGTMYGDQWAGGLSTVSQRGQEPTLWALHQNI